MASASSPAKTSGTSPDVLKSILSLFIFIHFFCVAAVLAANSERRSALQNRLVRIFAAYTQLLDFDPEFTPYYYTLGRDIDNDARLIIDLYADRDTPAAAQPVLKTITLPEGGSNWLGDRHRFFAIAKIVAMNSQPEAENDEVTSEIVRAVGARVIRENNAGRAVVRCVQRLSQPVDLSLLNPGFPPENPLDARYDVTTYTADVHIDPDDGPTLIKRSSRAEVAPRQNNSTTTAPPSIVP